MTDISEMKEIDLQKECSVLFCPTQKGVDQMCDICHEAGYTTKTTSYVAQPEPQRSLSDEAIERIITEGITGAILAASLTIIIFAIRALNKHKGVIFSSIKAFLRSAWKRRIDIQQIIVIISLIIISICLIKIAF